MLAADGTELMRHFPMRKDAPGSSVRVNGVAALHTALRSRAGRPAVAAPAAEPATVTTV